MSERTDAQPDNTLIQTLARLDADFQELKQKQPSKTGIVYLTESTATWDATATVGVAGATSFLPLGFRITYTSDGSQDYPLTNGFVDVFANGTDEAHRILLNRNTQAGIGMDQFMVEDKAYWGNKTQMSWTIDMAYKAVNTYYLKAHILGSCLGTVTVTRIY